MESTGFSGLEKDYWHDLDQKENNPKFQCYKENQIYSLNRILIIKFIELIVLIAWETYFSEN